MKRMVMAAAAVWVALAGMSRGEDLAVWAAPEGYKIDKFGKKIFVLDSSQNPDEIKKANDIWDAAAGTISIAGARGETVAFQLGIEGGGGLNDVDVAVTDLTGPGGVAIPAARLALFKMYYTRVTDKGSGPTNGPGMGQGWYPDALVPWTIGDAADYGGYDGPPFAVKAGEIQGVWADAAIPYGLPAGTYAGKLRVSSKEGTRELTLKLTVRNFDIPRKIHNTFFMNFGIDDLNQSGGYWLKGDAVTAYEDEVYRIARRHRFTAGNMYDNTTPKLEEPAGGGVRVDWTAYDARFDRVLNSRQNLFGPGEDPIEIWKVPLRAKTAPGGRTFPADAKNWEAMVAEIKNHWQRKGWDLSRAYAYLADEPGKDLAEYLNDMARRTKAVPGPSLRRQIAVYTILGKTWEGQKPVFDLWKDNLDMWMVAGDYYSVPAMDALPKGSLKGMYQGAEPFQGNETLDADGVAMRSWSWIAWMYRIDYQCYYSMSEAWRGYVNGRKVEFNNCEIWDTPRNRSWGLSQGVFIYPGRRVGSNLPIVNIRMKQVRRGQTDFEYFWLLRQAGEGAFADALARGVIRKALSEAAPAPEQYGYGKWSHNPADWDAAVRKAGEKLESLSGRLPKEPVSLSAP